MNNKYVLAFITPFIEEIHGVNENSSHNIQNYLLIDSIVDLEDFYMHDINQMKEFCLNMINIYIQTTSNINIINNYNRISEHLLKSSIDIVKVFELDGMEQVACVKTFWLRCFQRKYKKYFKRKQEIIKKKKQLCYLLKRQLIGK